MAVPVLTWVCGGCAGIGATLCLAWDLPKSPVEGAKSWRTMKPLGRHPEARAVSAPAASGDLGAAQLRWRGATQQLGAGSSTMGSIGAGSTALLPLPGTVLFGFQFHLGKSLCFFHLLLVGPGAASDIVGGNVN